MIGVGISTGEIAARLHALDAATAALVARMTVPPDAARLGRIDALVRALKAAGVWTKLECLYLVAAHDAQAARLNWISASFALTAVNAPGFTTDRGYAGDASTSYLATGWTPSASAVFVQDSASMGLWINGGTDTGAIPVIPMGVDSSYLNPRRDTDVMRGAVNSATVDWGASTTILGYSAISRTGAAAMAGYRNGAQCGSVSSASSTARSSSPLFLGARSNAGTPANFTNHRIAMAFMGAGLAAGEIAALHAAVATYLTALGAA